MYVKAGRLVVQKPFWRCREFWKAYRKANEESEGHIVLHFRFATHGVEGKKNTHPFVCSKGRVGLAHNGVLPLTGNWREDPRSDTHIWVDDVFKDREPDEIFSTELESTYWQTTIGNKLVFLGEDNRLKIWHEQLGSWDRSRWYSNSCAFQFKTYHVPPSSSASTYPSYTPLAGYKPYERRHWDSKLGRWATDDEFDREVKDFWDSYSTPPRTNAEDKTSADSVSKRLWPKP